MLSVVLEGHLGIEKYIMLAHQSMYWPGMNRDVGNVVAKCSICNAHCNQQTGEPTLLNVLPHRPWTKFGADIFTFMRKDYLLVVDCYSKYIGMALLEDDTSSCVILHLKSIFAWFGITVQLIPDNMPFGQKQ
jgi:Integrase zinc binding domain